MSQNPPVDQEPKESFNMAVATLARLDGILKRMEMVSEIASGLREQRLQIKLLRHFFSNATPLMGIAMDKTKYNVYKKRVFDIKIPTKIIKGKVVEYYSPKIDDEIMSLVMEIQIDIKGYFMPPAKKKRMF